LTAVLLDTCAIIWLESGLAPRHGVLEIIEGARSDDAVLVSPISAWEIAQKEKERPGQLGLSAPPLEVFRRIAAQPGVRCVPLSPEILTTSVELDGFDSRDPVDRMIVATGIAHDARIVTADRRMLAFSKAAIDYGAPHDAPVSSSRWTGLYPVLRFP
jgi:PIN domain nuclease of toxin-antitoxin system